MISRRFVLRARTFISTINTTFLFKVIAVEIILVQMARLPRQTFRTHTLTTPSVCIPSRYRMAGRVWNSGISPWTTPTNLTLRLSMTEPAKWEFGCTGTSMLTCHYTFLVM